MAGPRAYRGKRCFDIVVASLALVFAGPIMLVAAAAVAAALGTPVLFRQKRPGFDGEIFELLKLRTMSHRTDAKGQLLPDAERIPRLGRFLRATSLDELPELVNVLRGDMSLVGPRPLLIEYLPLYTPKQERRHEARPGITGWAQVKGRNTISWEEKFERDVWYVDHQSLLLDIKIVWLTLFKVLLAKGISQEGRATVDYFQGTQMDEREEQGKQI